MDKHQQEQARQCGDAGYGQPGPNRCSGLSFVCAGDAPSGAHQHTGEQHRQRRGERPLVALRIDFLLTRRQIMLDQRRQGLPVDELKSLAFRAQWYV